jgi:hypothetical protein
MAWKSILGIVLLSSSMANAQSKWTIVPVHEIDYQHRVGSAKLSPEQNQNLHAVLADILNKCTDYKGFDKISAYNNMRIELVPLDSNNNGYAVQGMGSCMCGATGNCSFWLFDSRMHLLLHDGAQGFAVLSQNALGMQGLVLSLHDSATESERTLFHFDGKRYVRRACANVDYSPNPARIQKHPTITLQPCAAK